MAKKTILFLKANFGLILTYSLGFLLFVILCFWVVIYSAGYKIDLEKRKIVQTSILDISCNTKGASIYVNGQLEGTDNAILKFIESGNYKVEVKKNDYATWTANYKLQEGEAKRVSSIVLFKSEPVIEEIPADGIDTKTLKKLSDTKELAWSGGEIYAYNSLVTRFSSNVDFASWYPNGNYIALQTEGHVKIIDLAGKNEVDLVEKTSSSPVIFINSGREMIFEQDNKVFSAKII